MSIVDPVSATSLATDTGALSVRAHESQVAEMGNDFTVRMDAVRQSSLDTANQLKGGPASIGAPGDMSAIQVGPAQGPTSVTGGEIARGPADSSLGDNLSMLDSLSAITWRMVSFEMSNAMMQKTDKSIKMFVQAQ